MPEPQKAFLFNKNSQPGENTPRDEGRPFDNLRSSHQQASLKDMTKGTQKMTPGQQGHPRTGKEHVYPLCPGVEGQRSHATRDCSRPEGSSGGRGGGGQRTRQGQAPGAAAGQSCWPGDQVSTRGQATEPWRGLGFYSWRAGSCGPCGGRSLGLQGEKRGELEVDGSLGEGPWGQGEAGP